MLTFICQYYCFMHLPYDGSCYLIDHRQGQELALLPVLALTSCKSPKTRRKHLILSFKSTLSSPSIRVNEDNWFFNYASEKVVFQNLWPNGKKKKKKKAEHKHALPFGISRLNLKNSLLLKQEMKTNCIYNSPWAEPCFLCLGSPYGGFIDSSFGFYRASCPVRTEMDHNSLHSYFYKNTAFRVQILLSQVMTGCEQLQKPTARLPSPMVTP